MKKAIYLSVFFLNFYSLGAQWTTNGSNIYYTGGNVGIGTSSPGAKLHVNNVILAEQSGATTDVPNIRLYNGSAATNISGEYRADLYLHTGTGQLTFRNVTGKGYNFISASTSSLLNILDNGNVGIGTSTPAGILDVVDGSSRMMFTGNGGKGDIFRLFGANGMNFAVNFHTPNSGDLISDLGINYSLDGSNGTSAYARIGSKKAPMIRLNAENGSIALYGENGSGSDYRTPAFNLGLYVNNSGNVGIGTTNPQAKLAVNGDIFSKKVKVTQTGWPDYVFDSAYQLRSLSQLEQYIQENKHLPDVPSASEVEKNGLDLGDNQAVLLKKIEEITLYVIELKKENEEMKEKINKLENKKR